MIVWVYSFFDDQIENQQKDEQVQEEHDQSTLVFEVCALEELNAALVPVSSLVVFCNRESHNNANDETTDVTQVVDVCLCYSYLKVEEQDHQDEDD